MSTTIRLKRSAVPGRVPTTTQLELGELAINTADGKIYIKQYDATSNTSSIVTFSADPDDILALLKTVDGAGSGLDADLLDGQQGSYYLDYTNFSNTPSPSDLLTDIKTVDGTGSGLDADLLDGQQGTHYLDYSNFTNTSALLTDITSIDGSGSGIDSDLLDGQQGSYYLNYSNFTNTPSASDLLTDIKTVDGSGSGLDADLLDGLNSTQFLRSDVDDTFNGNLTIAGDFTVAGNTTYVNTETILLSDNVITLNANFDGATATENAGIEVERGDESNVVLQWNETLNHWEIASGGITGRILTTGDEGAGNGLDADLLDGQQGTHYLDFGNFTNVPDPQISLAITGKVTGSGSTTLTNLGNGTINVSTELSNTGVSAGSYGNSTTIPVITVDEDGRLTSVTTSSVAGISSTSWYSANNTYQITTGDGSIFNSNISQFASNVDFGAGIDVIGNITVTGTVDGRNVSSDGAKLDGIQAGATADQTPAEILSAIKQVDGAGSGLDADVLDGQQGTYYLDFSNFTNLPDPEITVTGDVEGSVTLTNLGDGSLSLELTDTGVTAGSYGSSTAIPIINVDVDGRITSASTVDINGLESLDWYSSNNTIQIEGGDGTFYNALINTFADIAVEDLTANSIITQSNVTVNGNIAVTGTVDGRNVSADGSKLDGIESGATGDQTPAEILTAIKTVDGTGSGLDSDLLDGQQGSYYLNYNNFTNTPSASDLLTDIKTVDGAGSGLDADLLDGQQGTHYLDYSNFTNTPSATDVLNQIKTVDGSGSGLDADLLDGLNSTQFLRSDEDDTFTGSLTISGDLTVQGTTTTVNTETILLSDNIITLNSNFTGATATENAGIEIERGDESNVVLQWNETQNYWEIASGGITGRILTTGDEGAGNGLDSDTLDGQQGSYYLNYSNFTNTPSATDVLNQIKTVDGSGSGLDADLLDGQTGSHYLDYDNFSNTPDATDLLTDIKTVDGSGSGLDADLLDGQQGSYYLDFTNATNKPDPQIDLTLSGKVTGTGSTTLTNLGDGSLSITTALENTGVTADTYGTSLDIPVLTIDEDGRITSATTTQLAAGASVDSATWYSANNTFTIGLSDNSLFKSAISQFDANVDFGAGIDVTGNITVTGNVDGRNLSSDGVKLDGIETGATRDQTASEILTLLKTVDGSGSGLDADLLDGFTSQDFFDNANTVVQSFVSNSTITVVAGDALDGGGTFGLNEENNRTITIDHADTSSVSNVNNSNGTVIQDLTFDTYGHVQTVGSANLDTRYYTKTLLDSGQLDNRYYTETELNNGQLDNRYYTETELNNGQLDNRYYTETELNNGQLDTRYYTETESDSRFVNVAGDTMTGDLKINKADAAIYLNDNSGSPTQQGMRIRAESIDTELPGNEGIGIIFEEDPANGSPDTTPAVITTGEFYAQSTQKVFHDNYHPNADKWTTARTISLSGDLGGSVSIDGSQNVTLNATIQPNSVALGTDTTGNYVQSVSQGSGITVTGGIGEGSALTIAHADTSSVTNVSTSGKDVISSITFDTFGHVTARTTRTLDVLSQAEADERYVNETGDTMTGDLTVPNLNADSIVLNNSVHTSDSATTTSTAATNVFSFNATTYNSAEVIITATQGINRHITKLLVIHNGTTASATEFGTIYTDSSLATYSVGLSGGNVNLSVTAASTSSTEYKIAATLIID